MTRTQKARQKLAESIQAKHDYTRAVISERDAVTCQALDLAIERDELRNALERLRKMCNPEMSHQEALMVKIIDEAIIKELGQ
jgi:hypothetical protein